MDKKQIEAYEKQEELDVQSVMSSENGRRFCYKILELAGVFRSSAGQADFRTNETMFFEGRRDLGLRIMADLQKHTPKNYGLMLEEAREKEHG